MHAGPANEVRGEKAQEILVKATWVTCVDNSENYIFSTTTDVVRTNPTWAKSLDCPNTIDLFVYCGIYRIDAALIAA